MDELLEGIKDIVKFEGGKSVFHSKRVADQLTELIGSFELKPADWKRFVHYDKFKYTRNLICNDLDARFGLMVLAWGPGQKSPIHNHNGSHCIMRILQGSLIENLYEKRMSGSLESAGTENDLSLSQTSFENSEIYEKTRETVLLTGQTAYIHDEIGWHRVSNASTTKPAVSLHLYAPPIESCKTYCEIEGKIRAQAACPYHSVNGKLVMRK